MPTLDRHSPTLATTRYALEAGHFSPLGATPDAEGVNFSLFSQNATAVTLLLFETATSTRPFLEIPLDPFEHKTFQFWHVYVRGLEPGVLYAYRVDGPYDLSRGHRFDKTKLLIDPYAKGLSMALWDRPRYMRGDDPLEVGMRSVVVDTSRYDWEGDRPLNRPMRETVIYEVHVGGFTRSQTSGVQHPGTFAGLVEKIPYLKALGVTAVELLPVFAFDPSEIERVHPSTGKLLTNYWGYSTVSFFAPHAGYCASGADPLDEFRDMVKALHRAGIEVILDVVFNHTSEGDHWGPTLCFRGLDNSIYYHLEPGHPEHYRNFSGCGNTLNCNHPVVDKFIMDCLKFWVTEMHVDGFRFDLASILTRGEDGRPLQNPPVVWGIELSDEFSRTKIIAEAWDAAGLYQVGYFPGKRWADWNGQYRDDIRRFVRGDRGLIGKVASRLTGSSDIYQPNSRLPHNSINFVTCHDGFTLNDLVTYGHKYNLANGEDNRDGANDNWSANYGIEGPHPDLEPLRNRQIKNFMAILMLSQGVPMLYAGDEVRRTQFGNNNAYCHDNELNWFDWTLVDKHRDILRFTRKLIEFRELHDNFTRMRFFTGEPNARGVRDIEWHGCHLGAPGMHDPSSGVLAFTLGGELHDFHVMLNMEPHALSFELPRLPGRRWRRLVDTALESPRDFAEPGQEVIVDEPTYLVTDRSVVILQAF